MKKQEVMNVALSIVEQREYLESLDSLVTKLSKTDDEKERGELIAELGASLKQRLSYDRDVDSQYFYATTLPQQEASDIRCLLLIST